MASHTRKKIIFFLNINGTMVYDKKPLQKYVTDFYRDLLGTTTSRSISLHPSFWVGCLTLSLEQIQFFEALFTELEIKK
jgi:hypothetical protein